MCNIVRIALEIRHPAHVHHFKHFIWEMDKRGHIIKVLMMRKEMTEYLLDHYNIPYHVIGDNKKGIMKKAVEIVLSY